MSCPDDYCPALEETLLTSLGIADFGWVADRAAISEPSLETIRKLLETRLTQDQIGLLMADLGRGFASAVDMAQFQIGLWQELATHAEQISYTKPVPVKLGVLLRDYIRNLRLVLERAQRGEQRVPLDQFVRDIEQFPVLERLVTIHLEECLRWEVINPLRNAPEQAAEFLPQVLELLDVSIAAGVKRGPSEPALAYLAGYFAQSYWCASGTVPGRTYNAYEERDTGMGLEICRLLAGDLHAVLPEKYRPKTPADMAKPYRKAIEHLRELDRSRS
ncbi:hypothetical protein ALP8811_00983 [Aliiroseovarius pelagivivens]|uniref:Uncharacterized protein n=1 Tax=Aliiroseovarius pelagivivens TaxID=1639690 RepID=A0A2R8AJE0_9RHOB|nr:hypothetical protein [Aliiroseovarius pelagivivens]SPF75987.1 hypothetical protein ALP8811_00983 [Aliiroseovarius pelagivivens]